MDDHEVLADDQSVLIFGASGDLTARKLIPALFKLFQKGYLGERAAVIGVARREWSHEKFRQDMREALEIDSSDEETKTKWDRFAARMFYEQADLSELGEFDRLKSEVERREMEIGLSGRRVVYLAIAPSLFLASVAGLAKAGLIPPQRDGSKLRVVIEKPYGTDLASAQRLTEELSEYLSEQQIYRIDHYLGKETVQNILLFRFGNAIFEPLLDRRHVDHVQITVAESQGLERGRGGYYEQSGALRDVLQNHVLQLLCLLAMEPPAFFRGEEIRDEKLKVLQALRPADGSDISKWAVAGQYTRGTVKGQTVKAYREEDRVDPQSQRETFVAMEARIDNWRWAGVPFYMRTGKRLPTRVTEIMVQFHRPPLNLFTTVECEGDICEMVEAQPNQLIFRIQPEEAILLKFSSKRPGMQYQVHPVEMDFLYHESFDTALPEAYERLLLDVMRGDSTLFTRSDELEEAWRFVQPVLDQWEQGRHEPEPYGAGTWGPKGAEDLLARSGRQWRDSGKTNKRKR